MSEYNVLIYDYCNALSHLFRLVWCLFTLLCSLSELSFVMNEFSSPVQYYGSVCSEGLLHGFFVALSVHFWFMLGFHKFFTLLPVVLLGLLLPYFRQSALEFALSIMIYTLYGLVQVFFHDRVLF